MRRLGIALGILATVFCLPANAQTTSVMVLDQAGAQAVLQAAIVSAQQRNAPSAIAVVDPAGDLLAFQRMDGAARPARTSPSRRHEQQRGCSGRRRKSRIISIRAVLHSSPPGSWRCAGARRCALMAKSWVLLVSLA
jgi:Haem-degrading